jgi:hypothetical protein
VVIVNGKVVAKGENIEEMFEKVRQEYPPRSSLVILSNPKDWNLERK